jgi:hypothetical protein
MPLLATLHRDGPVPGQEFVEPAGGVIVDTGKIIGHNDTIEALIASGRDGTAIEGNRRATA